MNRHLDSDSVESNDESFCADKAIVGSPCKTEAAGDVSSRDFGLGIGNSDIESQSV